MEELTLPRAGGPRARGRIHGEHFRSQIGEIARIRADLVLAQGGIDSPDALRAVCTEHLRVLAAFDEALSEELLGIADGAGLPAQDVVVLNHYTDLKDIGRAAHEDEDCSAVVTGTPEGPLLGQTWDMHGSAEPYVRLLAIPETDDAPAVYTLTITGCLGLAGLNAHGVGVTINNLRSHDAQVGVVWPALVRRMLREDTVHAAQHVLMTAPMSSGHHYLIASEHAAVSVETSGKRKDVVFSADFAKEPTACFVHTNHCLSESVGEVSSVNDGSTTFERYAWLERSLAARPVADRDDLFRRFGSHDGYPRSVCTHLASPEAKPTRWEGGPAGFTPAGGGGGAPSDGPEAPHAMKTCGGVVMDLRRRELLAHAGCLHEATPTIRRFA